MAGKKFAAAAKKVDSVKKYTVEEAFKLVVETTTAKFDESIDVALRLGKNVKVVVFAKGPKETEAKNAGADFVGADDLVAKIQGGWLDFDKCIATPDMMATVSKVAKILGPRGLMPNPKVGTVTMNVGEAVTAEKKGKLDFRVDKAGIIHAGVGKKSMGDTKLRENFLTLLGAIMKAKPASSKGVYLQTITLSSTMGPGVKVDANQASGATGAIA